MAAPEVFLTGTTAGVWPVVSIDDRPIGDGRPGPVSAQLKARFQTVVAGGEPAFAHWLHWVAPSKPADSTAGRRAARRSRAESKS